MKRTITIESVRHIEANISETLVSTNSAIRDSRTGVVDGGEKEENPVKDISSGSPYNAKITAYTKKETCPDRKCIMANGKEAYIGAIACPRRIKLGTRAIIDGIEYICSDRTSLKYDGRFDIWFGETEEDYQRALKFGKQIKEVIIK